LNQQEFNYLFKAGSEINNLINSASTEEKLLAISIITELKHVQFTNAISSLINDSEVAVKRSAVMAACKLKISSLLPLILDLADHPVDKYLVIKALHQYGDQLFKDIRLLPDETLRHHTADLIKIAAVVKGANCKQFLLSGIQKLSSHTSKTIHALWIQDYTPQAMKETATLNMLLNSYLKIGIVKISDHRNIMEYHNDQEIVKNSLFNEIKADLVISLKICSMLFQKKAISRVLELMETEQQQKLYNAMEMIELELPKFISKDLIMLFDFILDPSANKIVAGNKNAKTLFNKIYFSDSFSYNPWTKAILLYCSWKNNKTDHLHDLIEKKDTSEHYIITETRDFVLKAIN
jgi:hypothetical protein